MYIRAGKVQVRWWTRNQVDGQVIHRTFPLEMGGLCPVGVTSGCVLKLCYLSWFT